MSTQAAASKDAGTPAQQPVFDTVRPHQGQLLAKTASTYPTLSEVIYESVQNGLDANATAIWVNINFPKRTMTIADNGEGVTISKFQQALTSVGSGMKKQDKLGRFGIGLISPLGKCESFTFVSTPKSNAHAYQEWRFDCAAVFEQRDYPQIPRMPRNDLWYGQGRLPWRTQVSLLKFKTDQVISRMSKDSLTENITGRFGPVMQNNNVTVYIVLVGSDGSKQEWNFKAKQFEGKPLPQKVIKDDLGGTTTFNLFLAKRPLKGKVARRNGKVSVGETSNPYRLEFSSFSKAAADYLTTDAANALTSGNFEGEILTTKARLAADRRSFEKNEALLGLCEAIQLWYEEVGCQYQEEVSSQRRAQRWQETGESAMQVLEQLLSDPSNAALQKVIDSFKHGTTGNRHSEPDSSVVGQQEHSSVTVKPAAKSADTAAQPGADTGESNPAGPRLPNKPLTVEGPKGSRRVVVKRSGLGLQFSYDEMEGSAELYELDRNSGILRFNIRHPLWDMCENAGKTCLAKLQEFSAIQALTLETIPDDSRRWVEVGYQELLGPVAFTLAFGDRIAGRRFGAAPAKKDAAGKEPGKEKTKAKK